MKKKWIIVAVVVLIFIIITSVIIIRLLRKEGIVNENITLKQKLSRNIQIVKT